MTPRPALLLLILALAAPGAGALAGSDAPGGKAMDCYCTDTRGARVDLGQRICLFVDGRAFVALCEMALNNPIWRDTGESCSISGPGAGSLPGAEGAAGVDLAAGSEPRPGQGRQPAADPRAIDPKV